MRGVAIALTCLLLAPGFSGCLDTLGALLGEDGFEYPDFSVEEVDTEVVGGGAATLTGTGGSLVIPAGAMGDMTTMVLETLDMPSLPNADAAGLTVVSDHAYRIAATGLTTLNKPLELHIDLHPGVTEAGLAVVRAGFVVPLDDIPTHVENGRLVATLDLPAIGPDIGKPHVDAQGAAWFLQLAGIAKNIKDNKDPLIAFHRNVQEAVGAVYNSRHSPNFQIWFNDKTEAQGERDVDGIHVQQTIDKLEQARQILVDDFGFYLPTYWDLLGIGGDYDMVITNFAKMKGVPKDAVAFTLPSSSMAQGTTYLSRSLVSDSGELMRVAIHEYLHAIAPSAWFVTAEGSKKMAEDGIKAIVTKISPVGWAAELISLSAWNPAAEIENHWYFEGMATALAAELAAGRPVHDGSHAAEFPYHQALASKRADPEAAQGLFRFLSENLGTSFYVALHSALNWARFQPGVALTHAALDGALRASPEAQARGWDAGHAWQSYLVDRLAEPAKYGGEVEPFLTAAQPPCLVKPKPIDLPPLSWTLHRYTGSFDLSITTSKAPIEVRPIKDGTPVGTWIEVSPGAPFEVPFAGPMDLLMVNPAIERSKGATAGVSSCTNQPEKASLAPFVLRDVSLVSNTDAWNLYKKTVYEGEGTIEHLAHRDWDWNANVLEQNHWEQIIKTPEGEAPVLEKDDEWKTTHEVHFPNRLVWYDDLTEAVPGDPHEECMQASLPQNGWAGVLNMQYTLTPAKGDYIKATPLGATRHLGPEATALLEGTPTVPVGPDGCEFWFDDTETVYHAWGDKGSRHRSDAQRLVTLDANAGSEAVLVLFVFGGNPALGGEQTGPLGPDGHVLLVAHYLQD